MESAKMKLSMVLSQDQMSRLTFRTDDKTGLPLVELDLHKLSAVETKRAFHSVLACCRDKFIFRITHGYNHGTTLKNVTNELLGKSDRYLENLSERNNPGATIALMAAA